MIDPSRLIREMHPRTLGLWRALWVIDPQDENRADWRAGEIAAAVLKSQGAKKSDGTYFTPADFVPYVDAQEDPEERRRRELEREEAQLIAYLERVSGHQAQHR